MIKMLIFTFDLITYCQTIFWIGVGSLAYFLMKRSSPKEEFNEYRKR